MTETKYRADLTLDDFDALMDDAAGKPRTAPKLTSYGPAAPSAPTAPSYPYTASTLSESINNLKDVALRSLANSGNYQGTSHYQAPHAYPAAPAAPAASAFPAAPAYPAMVVAPRASFVPAAAPYYNAYDPMPRHSAVVHVALALFTGGFGNIFYGAWVWDKQRQWKLRNGYSG